MRLIWANQDNCERNQGSQISHDFQIGCLAVPTQIRSDHAVDLLSLSSPYLSISRTNYKLGILTVNKKIPSYPILSNLTVTWTGRDAAIPPHEDDSGHSF